MNAVRLPPDGIFFVLHPGTAAEGSGFTRQPGTLSNDYFVNLLDMRTAWKAVPTAPNQFEGRDRSTGELLWTATRVDLVLYIHNVNGKRLAG